MLVRPPKGAPVGPDLALDISGVSGAAEGKTSAPKSRPQTRGAPHDVLWLVLPVESSVARWLVDQASAHRSAAGASTAFTLEVASARRTRDRGMRFTADNCVVRNATIEHSRAADSGSTIRVTIAHRGLTWIE